MAVDKERVLSLARDKRHLAVQVRRAAASVSLMRDREALLAQAAAIEAEADQLERQAKE